MVPMKALVSMDGHAAPVVSGAFGRQTEWIRVFSRRSIRDAGRGDSRRRKSRSGAAKLRQPAADDPAQRRGPPRRPIPTAVRNAINGVKVIRPTGAPRISPTHFDSDGKVSGRTSRRVVISPAVTVPQSGYRADYRQYLFTLSKLTGK